MFNLEESTKIAKETRWCTLARELADAHRAGRSIQRHIEEAQKLRAHEQRISDRNMHFAALMRQIGDAAAKGRDTADLVRQLVDLREREIGVPVEYQHHL